MLPGKFAPAFSNHWVFHMKATLAVKMAYNIVATVDYFCCEFGEERTDIAATIGHDADGRTSSIKIGKFVLHTTPP